MKLNSKFVIQVFEMQYVGQKHSRLLLLLTHFTHRVKIDIHNWNCFHIPNETKGVSRLMPATLFNPGDGRGGPTEPPLLYFYTSHINEIKTILFAS